MGYLVEYLPDKKIVGIKMKGRINFQTAEKYSKEALKLARQNECSKFLIDHVHTSQKEGVKKFHTDGDVLQQFGFVNTDRIAIIISNPDSETITPEIYSQNSRWSMIKYFYSDNIQEAYDWLMESE